MARFPDVLHRGNGPSSRCIRSSDGNRADSASPGADFYWVGPEKLRRRPSAPDYDPIELKFRLKEAQANARRNSPGSKSESRVSFFDSSADVSDEEAVEAHGCGEMKCGRSPDIRLVNRGIPAENESLDALLINARMRPYVNIVRNRRTPFRDRLPRRVIRVETE